MPSIYKVCRRGILGQACLDNVTYVTSSSPSVMESWELILDHGELGARPHRELIVGLGELLLRPQEPILFFRGIMSKWTITLVNERHKDSN